MALSAEDIARFAYEAGFRGEALTTAVAIALAESGGRPEARNPNGEDSRGLWQINVAPNVRPNRWGDLYDPAVNARAAFEISGGGSNFKPWTTYSGATAHGRAASYTRHLSTAQSAVEAIGENPGAPSYSGVSAMVDDDGLASNASPDEIRSFIQRNMPEFAFMLSVPEVFDVVVGWVRDDAPEEDLAVRIRATEYFKTTPPSARQWWQLAAEDPAAAAQQWNRRVAEVHRILGSNGLAMEEVEIGEFVGTSLLEGWNTDDLTRAIIQRRSDQRTSTARINGPAMMAEARRWGLTLDQFTAEEWATKMQTGEMSPENFTVWLNVMSKQRFAHDEQMIGWIDKGGTPDDYYAAHKAMIAETLELNPKEIDVFSGQFAQVSDFFDTETKKRRGMTVSEARRLALKDDRVKRTGWYKQTDAQWAGDVGRLLNILPGGG